RGRGREEVIRLGVDGQELLDATPDLWVSANFIEERRAVLRAAQLAGREEELLDVRNCLLHRCDTPAADCPLYRAVRINRPVPPRCPADFQRSFREAPAPRSSARLCRKAGWI